MTWSLRDWWRRRHATDAVDTSGEAQHYLRRLEQRQPIVDRLSRELAEAKRRNHFSAMVADAMRRGTR